MQSDNLYEGKLAQAGSIKLPPISDRPVAPDQNQYNVQPTAVTMSALELQESSSQAETVSKSPDITTTQHQNDQSDSDDKQLSTDNQQSTSLDNSQAHQASTPQKSSNSQAERDLENAKFLAELHGITTKQPFQDTYGRQEINRQTDTMSMVLFQNTKLLLNLPENQENTNYTMLGSTRRRVDKVVSAIKARWQEYKRNQAQSCSLWKKRFISRFSRKIVCSVLFERFILFLILLNCIFLALTSNKPGFSESILGKFLKQSEVVFLVLFATEMVLKILAFGFMGLPGSYIHDGWNRLDFIVVVLGCLEIVSTELLPKETNYTAIRTVRILRPLRTITGVEGMRVLVLTLLKSLPMLIDVMILCAFAYFIFGIVGVQTFNGALQRRCMEPQFGNYTDPNSIKPSFELYVDEHDKEQFCSGPLSYKLNWKEVNGSIVQSSPTVDGIGKQCDNENLGLVCSKYENPNHGIISFDDIFSAWLTIFQCISLEGWTDVMYQVVDSVSGYAWIYFVILIVFGSFFAVNLALAVLYLQFTQSSESRNDNQKNSQQDKSNTDQDSDAAVPVHSNMWAGRKVCYKIQQSNKFEILTIILIIVNTLVMAAEYNGSPGWQLIIGERVNEVLTIYFAIEMMIKVIGLGFRGYCKDKMNIFDMLIVFSSLIELIVARSVSNSDGQSYDGRLSVLRAFRLMRIFKLARQWKELNKIINTVFKSLSSIAYLSLILLLFMFVASLLGMQQFGYSFKFCDHIPGASPKCPPGQEQNCPPKYDCYLPCSIDNVNQWILVDESPYNGLAYCEKFPRVYGHDAATNITDGTEAQYLAQVGKSIQSRAHFDDIMFSFITIFQILTGENWNEVMYDGIRSKETKMGQAVATIYFIILVLVGNYIILNLFLAILLDNFAGVGSEQEDEEETVDPQEQADVLSNRLLQDIMGQQLDKSTAQQLLRQDTLTAPSDAVDQEDVNERLNAHYQLLDNQQHDRLQGRSLYIFGPKNRIRVQLAKIVNHKHFEFSIITLIVLSSLLAAFDTPRVRQMQQGTKVQELLRYLDMIFVAIFTIEAMLKIIVSGFIVGKNSYLRKGWNILDFVCVTVGVAVMFINNNVHLRTLRCFRTLRALRPIRVASKAEGMKVVVNALFQSIPAIANVTLVCLLFFLIFGIQGIQFLSGTFDYCQNTATMEQADAYYIFSAEGTVINKTWCGSGNPTVHSITTSNYHAEIPINETHTGVAIPEFNITTKWVSRYANFNNIFRAMLTLFEIASLEMWPSVMWNGIDANDKDLQPIQNKTPYIAFYFIGFIIVGSFFVLNLFVGVTIDKFHEMQSKQQKRNVLLTEEQEQWMTIQKLLSNTKPVWQYVCPTNPLRKAVFRVVNSTKFDMVIIALIIINVTIMAFDVHHCDNVNYGFDDAHCNSSQTKFTQVSNLMFAQIFTIEAFAKIYALGFKAYFKDVWNAFDFFVVVGFAQLGIVLSTLHRNVPVISLLRVFRVARIFRLIPKAKRLRTLFQTLLISLPALVNVGGVMFLFFFIFSVMGMNLFGMIKKGEFINDHANFDDFGHAILLLFRMATGESWNGVMHDCANNKQCIEIEQSFVYQDTQYHQGMWLDQKDHFAYTLDRHRVLCASNQVNNAKSCELVAEAQIANLHQAIQIDRCTPSGGITILYFLVFVILCGFVLLNLVIAVILDNFQFSSQYEELSVSSSHLLRYVKVWGDLDPYATNYIPIVKLVNLIQELDPPMGMRGQNYRRQDIMATILTVDIPNREGYAHFMECLHALSGRVSGTQLPEDEEAQILEKLQQRLPIGLGPPKYTAGHYFSALYVQAAVRGFLARYKMRNMIKEIYSTQLQEMYE